MAAQPAPDEPAPWAMTFTERLKRARIAAGVSADEMAEVLECSARQIRNYESGASPIKPRDVRDWAMRCGGARIHRWIQTGEIPAADTDPGQETSVSRCIPIDAGRTRRRADRPFAKSA